MPGTSGLGTGTLVAISLALSTLLQQPSLTLVFTAWVSHPTQASLTTKGWYTLARLSF